MRLKYGMGRGSGVEHVGPVPAAHRVRRPAAENATNTVWDGINAAIRNRVPAVIRGPQSESVYDTIEAGGWKYAKIGIGDSDAAAKTALQNAAFDGMVVVIDALGKGWHEYSDELRLEVESYALMHSIFGTRPHAGFGVVIIARPTAGKSIVRGAMRVYVGKDE